MPPIPTRGSDLQGGGRPTRLAGLNRLLTQEEAVRRPPGRLLRLVGQIPPEAAAIKIDLLRRIQIAHPGDFWATYLLGTAAQQSFDWDERCVI